MSEIKNDEIQKAIKEAKEKKIKIAKYLSGGNIEYENAINSVRLSGIFATIPATLYLLMLVSIVVLVSFVAVPASQKSGTNNIGSPSLGITIVLYAILSIIQFIFCYRMRRLSREPNRIRVYLIFTLINSILPVALALISGQFALPGILPLLAFVYSIIALSNFKKYIKWYNEFKYPIKQKTNKRKNNIIEKDYDNDKQLENEIDDSDETYFDDEL